MHLIAQILTALVALLHVYFLVLEMFWWTEPAGRRAFGSTAEFAASTKTLAANQGLYNGFLAAGLVWSLVHPDPTVAFQIALFFLGCVIVAGVFGGATVSRKILAIQALPALLAFAAQLLG